MITAKANVTYVLEGSLSQKEATYTIVEGSMTVIFSRGPASGCDFSGKVTVPIVASPTNRLRINTTTLRYSGYGQTAGPFVDVTVGCPGQQPHVERFDSSSIWLVANESDGFVTDGGKIEGSYKSSSTSRFSWLFSRVD